MSIRTRLSSNGTVLGELDLGVVGTNRLDGQDSITFAKTDSVNVITTIAMKGQSNFRSLVHEFRAVSPDEGELNGDGAVDVGDLNYLAEQISNNSRDSRFDLNRTGNVNSNDYRYWVNKIMGTYIGDANLDGQFSTRDLVQVFVNDEYEDGVRRNSSWSTGDFNGDQEFGYSDLTYAFLESGDVFEKGTRIGAAGVVTVPEPCIDVYCILLPIVASVVISRIQTSLSDRAQR